MSQSESPDFWKTTLKTSTEFIGYPAILVSYLLALSGRLPGQAPVTTSIATILITSLFVVVWRWRGISRQKKSLLFRPRGASPNKNRIIDSLLDPVRRLPRKDYVYSLERRRIEGSILLCVVLLSTAWTAFHFRDAAAEFEDPNFVCSQPNTKKSLRVVITDIPESVSLLTLSVEERVYDFLSARKDEGQFELCRWKEAIEVRDDALEVAAINKADILLWGRIGVIYEIHLEVPALKRPDSIISEMSYEEASSSDFQFTEDEHLGYVTQVTMSEILFLNGEAALAREELEKALISAQQTGSPKDISKGYFLLGFFYDPNTTMGSDPDPQKAIYAYSQAFDLQDDFYAAVLNRGSVRSKLGLTQAAIADYTLLIERDTPLKCIAHISRAELQNDPQEEERDLKAAIACFKGPEKAKGYFYLGLARIEFQDYQGAMEYFKQGISADPQEYRNYHYLGMTQLWIGQREEAVDTYRQLSLKLDEKTRQSVLNDLGDLAKARHNLKDVIEEISAELRAAKPQELNP